MLTKTVNMVTMLMITYLLNGVLTLAFSSKDQCVYTQPLRAADMVETLQTLLDNFVLKKFKSKKKLHLTTCPGRMILF